jgi:hypothetical protein
MAVLSKLEVGNPTAVTDGGAPACARQALERPARAVT